MWKKNRSVTAIIPARHGSSRLRAKPLLPIGSVSLIQRVYENTVKSNLFDEIIIATDHADIFDLAESFGADAVITSREHLSGTDRCAEVSRTMDPDAVIVNIQGDEIVTNWDGMDGLFDLMQEGVFDVGTLASPIVLDRELFSPNTVKVVFDKLGRALYFSRAPIPFARDTEESEWIRSFSYFRHIGVYAYTNRVLQDLAGLSAGGLEQAEKLEQLRWMEHGYDIGVVESGMWESIGVDTDEDLKRARAEFG
jgi:3-deoxy-manno-octulosonate cytidylyltransferase (CMP-KDO synthetase)